MRFSLKSIVLLAVCSFISQAALAQCGTASGDQVSYGAGSWIGYVYDGVNSFAAATYQGTIAEAATFDESFCGNNCNFTAASGCSVNSETFTVRFKMQQNFACGTYLFTIGADDGVRLSIDGGATFLINDYSDHPYRTATGTAFLSGGNVDLVLEYYENTGNNRVTYTSALVVAATGGVIGSDQNTCQFAPIDPAAFTSTSPAIFCSGATPNYQWQDSPDNVTFTDIPSATSITYDIPAGFAIGTRYYRRSANNGSGTTVFSNVVTVTGDSPLGDQTTYGVGSWIGYAYDGVDTYANGNYQGYFTESATFNESFCGNNCTFPLNGCDINTETFTVRLKMQIAYCGTYTFTIGADDGVRLSIDGGSTYLINDYTNHGYRTVTSASVYLNGTYNLVLEYFENAGGNQVSFSNTLIVPGTGGTVGGDQTLCQTPLDPAAFTSSVAASFCSAISPNYQWQDSPDNVTFSDIGGATSITYDIPSGLSVGTHYYRRSANDGTSTAYSNVITIIGDSPQGDQTTYGVGSWIGYTYDGANNYASANYQGNFTEAAIFDESFCGANCTFAINGCDINTETFTVRFKMRITLPSAGYTFTIGADDGVRLSINGGSTNLLNDYSDHGYRTVSSGVVNLNGTYDFILEFYENGGGNRVSFSYSAGPLPVKWSYFDGYYENGVNTLNWKTSSEKNNNGFEIERSTNGVDFEKMGWVKGHGTVSTEHSYSFTDSLPSMGYNYYRLKQIDFDNAHEYSRLIPVFVNEVPSLQLYPNPMHDYVYLSGLENAKKSSTEITLTNTITRQTYTLKQDTSQPARFLLSQVEPGVYMAQIKTGGKVIAQKIVVK